jgi:hypothetical protein
MSILLAAMEIRENELELLDEVQLELKEVYDRLDTIVEHADDTPTLQIDKSAVVIVSLRRGRLIKHVILALDEFDTDRIAGYVRLRLKRLPAPV